MTQQGKIKVKPARPTVLPDWTVCFKFLPLSHLKSGLAMGLLCDVTRIGRGTWQKTEFQRERLLCEGANDHIRGSAVMSCGFKRSICFCRVLASTWASTHIWFYSPSAHVSHESCITEMFHLHIECYSIQFLFYCLLWFWWHCGALAA